MTTQPLIAERLEPHQVQLPGHVTAPGRTTFIAGPCAVESEEQAVRLAHAVREAGAAVFRGGAFKPRTSPYSFQGLGRRGLEILRTVRAETGLLICTEALSTECLDDELSKLEQRLHSQLLQKLERQRNRQRREAIYTFPQQFSALRGTISNFVKQIFDQSRFQQPVKLRGLYFTSATQEGSPIDRIMGSLASNFGIDQQAVAPPAEHGKSFFIHPLLSVLIVNESGLVGSNHTAEQRLPLLR